MRRFVTNLALCLGAATQLQATEFRCYPPDPAGFFLAIQASPEPYLIVRGRFDFDMALLPNGGMPTAVPVVRPIPARFEGQTLGADGFVTPAGFDLILQPGCIMVSCTYLAPGAEVVAFVRHGAGGYILDADPCLTPLFAATDDTESQLASCLTGGDCAAVAIAD